jgi:opacity protein-like surface antigen
VKIFLATLVLLLSTTSAFAGSKAGYIGLFGGVTMPADSNLTDTGGNTAQVSYKSGYVVGGVFGACFPNGIRFEEELSSRAADLDQLKFQGASGGIREDASIFAVMTNLYYDMKTGTAATPYIGTGLGLGKVNLSDAYSAATGAHLWTSGRANVLAYQFAVGLAYDITDTVAADIGYRYFGTSEADFGPLKMDFQSHNIQFGMRYKF